MKRSITGIILASIIFLSFTADNQKYMYYQMFMYNFTKYIQWPANAQSGDFVVGVVGNSEIIPNLERMATQKKVNGRSITVRKFADMNEVTACHMLFVPVTKSKSFDDIKSKLDGTSTLLITEKNGLGKAGSGINFIVVGGKLKFELNKQATEKANLKVSGDLAKLAILI